ncbi:hypothetical protein M747DRAFT_299071 [Aspergillus niger ATCC 13496]|uniref:Uncharacterized protein n=1 Tax=Aspergillus niger ATCC 13496 TaxID=1353008 RepID=A0A370BRL9_ASPNG|nr:hypothetical protein M747DRAFT_299071 [Aspergillus niger ATCC 13496]
MALRVCLRRSLVAQALFCFLIGSLPIPLDRLGLVEGGGDWPIVQQGLLIGASTQFPRWVPEVPRPH